MYLEEKTVLVTVRILLFSHLVTWPPYLYKVLNLGKTLVNKRIVEHP